MNDHFDELKDDAMFPACLSHFAKVPLFLNVEEPSDDKWQFQKADALVFDTHDTCDDDGLTGATEDVAGFAEEGAT